MNKVILIGRLVADPELRSTQSGKSVASYRLAVDRQNKQDGQPDADFLNCVAWGKNAEFASKHLTKGTKIAVEGRIQTGSYEKNGVKHFTTDIIVERHEFCESKKSSPSPDYGGSYQAPMPSYPAPNQQFAEMSDDDGGLPF
jgi:single-strand DNA-binding protein